MHTWGKYAGVEMYTISLCYTDWNTNMAIHNIIIEKHLFIVALNHCSTASRSLIFLKTHLDNTEEL